MSILCYDYSSIRSFEYMFVFVFMYLIFEIPAKLDSFLIPTPTKTYLDLPTTYYPDTT